MLLPHEYTFFLRSHLPTFIERVFRELNPRTPFISGPHIDLIAMKLEACRLGLCNRLIINVPPRNLKSICASIAFVAWYLGHDPTKHVICASYGQDLADTLARHCRTIMRSAWYEHLFQSTRVPDRQAVSDFSTTAKGTRMATSVGGVLTGRGADLIIVDDPIKPDEALSEPRRAGANSWFDNSLLSRLNDKEKGCIVIVMQRLHQDDLVGHVLLQGHWDVLSLPAIAEDDEAHVIEDILGQRVWRRSAGGVLHPQRESLDTLRNIIRPTVGEYNFAAQYQQAPIPLGGAMVKVAWLKRYRPEDLPPNTGFVVQSWDTANKATDLNDFSVCTTWIMTSDKFYLIDVFRKRLNYPDLKRAVRDLANRFSASTIVIEDKASGTQLIQDLKSEGLLGVTAYEPPAGTDKQMRLYAQTAVFENGHVFLPEQAPWLPEYIYELTGFPGTKYDDQVDSTTQALDHMRGPGATLAVFQRLGEMYGHLYR
jgi:predicted phage terminase large subunit-like protein